jgi:threonine dehydrogenase-like Zn-dependent dehydrogenase
VRQLVFGGPGRLAVEEAAPPPVGPGEVRVAVHSVGVCGSDVHGYTGASDRRVPGMVMGHEAAGTVVERGEGVREPAEGAFVAVNPAVTCGRCPACQGGRDNLCPERRLYGCVLELPGAFADAIVVRAENVVALDGPAPREWGALVEPFAVGDHGAALVGPPPARGVLVVGGGPIGLGAALSARRRGAARVVVSEPLAHRRAVASALGLETWDPTGPGPPPEPFGAAVECVAAPATLRAALEAVEPGGLVVLVGLGQPELPLPVTPVVVGERGIRGSFNYTRGSFADVARWVMSGEVDLAPVIESHVDLDGLVAAFAEYADGRRQDVKTLYQPGAPAAG